MSDTAAHVSQLTEDLTARYLPIIPPRAKPGKNPEEIRQNQLSRSLAAYAIEKLAKIPVAIAAASVIDDYDDNGIDAIYFDPQSKRLWLIQAKFQETAPDMGENKKFCDGISDLLEGRFHKFNKQFASLRPRVEQALDCDELIVVGCHIHLGRELGPHATTDLNQLKAELNKFHTRFEWSNIGLSIAHGWLTEAHATKRVDDTITLKKWYGVDSPRKAYYGLITAQQLAALYRAHEKALFERNIRHYLGNESVNKSIGQTVADRPKELFFLNNGITAVCSKIRPKPGATNDEGAFAITGLSIVNGAQTVGSIAAQPTVPPEAQLLVTLIEVGDADDNLGPEITKCRNTQNAIRNLHFAALDPTQERLRREMKVSGIEYRYRPGADHSTSTLPIIEIDDAALTLAAFSGNTEIVVAAKREVGQLHDKHGKIYPQLFSNSLSGVRLARFVLVFRYLNSIMSASEQAEEGRRRMFYRHGRLFTFHLFARRNRALIESTKLELDQNDKVALSRLLLELAETTYTLAELKFAGSNKGYLAIFRNLTDCKSLAAEVTHFLDNPPVQPPTPSPAAPTPPTSSTPPPAS